MDNIYANRDGPPQGSPSKKENKELRANWLAGGGGGGPVNNDPAKYNAGGMKQGFLRSSMGAGFGGEGAPAQKPADEYAEKRSVNIPGTNQTKSAK